jgi:hypothetical protein
VSKQQRANTLIWLATFSAVLVSVENIEISGDKSATAAAIAKLNFPKAGFAVKPPKKGCKGNEPINNDSVGLYLLP